MIALFYEDHEVGQKAAIGSYRFTREAIIAFASDFDPQPFHLDEAAAAKSIFGGLCASGWHTVSASMRVLVDYRDGLLAAARARGEALPAAGLGVGARNLRWSAPVRPGDEIAFTFEVLSARVTKRPEWGLLTGAIACVNQDGREVCSYALISQIARRPQATKP